jgi:hypothetical protein
VFLLMDVFDRSWIEKAKEELQNWLTQGALREGFELHGESVVHKS